ncbi:hypothetical protein N7492_005527 [Penicillium capsulatum]|uniref:C3H1-type domain-containing protein n=1 Tax=Penicillium capsulatum TaxID=69766 RepID=A0A9W9I9K0_9EURO|nr:hypothetical protein N7492_005527 [Penicillium capsulatum]KAJ6135372.1 hypothetical protein N7512_000532 [Penicillium capsulatum]
MSSQARPAFFCSRPNGTLTPLIGVDELPAHVSIRGVSRNLSAGATQGMTSCGVAVPRPEPWILENVGGPTPYAQVDVEATAELSRVLVTILSDPAVPAHHRLAVQNILCRMSEGSHGPAGPAANPQRAINPPTQPSHYWGPQGNGNNQGHSHAKNVSLLDDKMTDHDIDEHHPQTHAARKLYCSYWIRHGECDYQQQGCLFKHEMPTDPAMLEKLGLRDIPRWYREKHGVASLLDVTLETSQEKPTNKALQYPRQEGASGSYGPSAGPNNHAHQHRIGNLRSKNTRGPNYNGNKGRGNNGWNRNGQRNDASSTPWGKNNQAITTPSRPTTRSATILPDLRARLGPPIIMGPLVSRSIERDSQGVSRTAPENNGTRRGSLQCRPRNLTPQDAYGPAANTETDENLFRMKSRYLFNFGGDGRNESVEGEPSGRATNSAVSPAAPKTAENKKEASTSPISELMKGSTAIDPDEPLLDFGAIGEPVIRPDPFQSIGEVLLPGFLMDLVGKGAAKGTLADDESGVNHHDTKKPTSQ